MNPKKLLVVLPIAALILLSSMPFRIAKGEDQPLFQITLVAPGNANMVRRQWGQLIVNSLRQVGIDAKIVYLGWASVYDRILTPSRENVGKTWEQNGWDALLIGYTPGLQPEPRQLFSGEEGFLAPDGQNYYLWQNATSDKLLDTFITSIDPKITQSALFQWQTIAQDAVPASQIVYQTQPSIVNPKLSLAGQWWLYFNVQPGPEFLMGKDTVVYCSTGEITSLIPPTSNSWYDTIINSVIFNGLAQVAPDMSDLSIPALLTDWKVSNDGIKWTFNCREGVRWHDGSTFTADDVLFSLWSLMNPNTGSQFVGYYQSVYGNKVTFTYSDGKQVTLGNGTRVGTIKATDAYTIEANLPILAEGKPYGYFDPYLLTFANNIIPKHIFENIEPAQWSNTVFNTGQGSTEVNGVIYTGPIGTGPYKWESYDPVTQLIHMVKNTDYWNKTALESKGLFGVKDYYVKFIADKTPAIAALKNGQVDMLDYNYDMGVDIKTVDPSWGTVVLMEGTGRQELGYNMHSPIWGTGVDTPLGKQNPARAAEAARYIRQAFDYAIPRQLIIDNLLEGLGLPGATSMLPTQNYYNKNVVSRPYDLNKARELLTKAGYTVPGYSGGTIPPTPTPASNVTVSGFILGMSSVVSGFYVDQSTGNPLATREIQLMSTKDNTTYTQSSQLINKATTDLSGFYTFTITPTSPGTWYYFLFDSKKTAGEEWTYLGKLGVVSVSDAFKPITTTLSTIQQQGQTTQQSLLQVQQGNQQLQQKIDTLTTQLNNAQASSTNNMYLAGAAIIIALIAIALTYMRKK